MKIATAQINCIVGDLSGNAKKILAATRQAKKNGAELVITPELALSGYPPGGLLSQVKFNMACQQMLHKLIREINGITLIVGHPHHHNNQLFNAASVICDGRIFATYYKNILTNTPFFNESLYFDAGTDACIFTLSDTTFEIKICADFWLNNSATCNQHSRADITLVLSASAYRINMQNSRYKIARQHINKTSVSVVHVNLVGGQDELVFDGASFVMNSNGQLTHQFDQFTETLGLIDIQNNQPVPGKLATLESSIGSIYQALCLGVEDYIGKNSFPGVILGLSGGVDSALALVIAVDALGADRVQTVMMPSQYTANISIQDANAMVEALGIRHRECDIQLLFKQFQNTLTDKLQVHSDCCETSTTQENLQARIRGTLLMALSNYTGSIVLTTGNKSEMAVGYCTLYGDMAGGFAVLKDVSKTLVYKLCHYRNQQSKVIPARILQRAPSAELRPDQTDQDNLPSYTVLDGIMKAYMEDNLPPNEIIKSGYSEKDVNHIIHLIHLNEYKRRQSPLGIRITNSDFGNTWQYPVTAKYS